ncbi:hypothetical protein FQN60_013947, partial [Etheostoma spectabile]
MGLTPVFCFLRTDSCLQGTEEERRSGWIEGEVLARGFTICVQFPWRLELDDFIYVFRRAVSTASMAESSASEVIFISVNHNITLMGRGASRGIDPNASMAQPDLEAEACHTGSFRKRQGSKGFGGGGVLALGQEPPCLEHSSLPRSPGPPGCNTNGNNGYSFSQEEAPESNGSKVSLCPPEPMGTPRSIHVSKRSRLKPPPPPRRDLGSSPVEPAGPVRDVSTTTTTTICTRRVGQYTLVELGSGAELQTNDDGQEKRS